MANFGNIFCYQGSSKMAQNNTGSIGAACKISLLYLSLVIKIGCVHKVAGYYAQQLNPQHVLVCDTYLLRRGSHSTLLGAELRDRRRVNGKYGPSSSRTL